METLEPADPQSFPQVFSRTVASKTAGLLVYLLVGAGFTAIVAIPFMAVVSLVFPHKDIADCLIISFFVVLPFMEGFCVWRFVLRLSERVHLWPDRLEATLGSRPRVIPYAEMELQVITTGRTLNWRKRLIVRSPDRRSLTLDSEEWPIARIEAALNEVAVPRITESLRRRMDRHEEVLFREPRGSRARAAIFALALIGWGVVAGLGLAKGTAEDRPRVLRFVLLGILAVPLFISSLLIMRKRGLVLSQSGIRTPGARDWVHWSEVERVERLSVGIRITLRSGAQPLTASEACANLASLAALLEERVSHRFS